MDFLCDFFFFDGWGRKIYEILMGYWKNMVDFIMTLFFVEFFYGAHLEAFLAILKIGNLLKGLYWKFAHLTRKSIQLQSTKKHHKNFLAKKMTKIIVYQINKCFPISNRHHRQIIKCNTHWFSLPFSHRLEKHVGDKFIQLCFPFQYFSRLN